ncbi:MAG: hypothetical protein SGI73_02450 [Chloroflexota bacterium]|nr:hypothetical protein [Chloroflexota bacterium]
MKRTILILVGMLAALAVVIIVTLALTPGTTEPAFAVAEEFVRAAGRGDDAAASAFLTDELRAAVAARCLDGSIAACVRGYTPPEWGALYSIGVRRTALNRDTGAWDVDLFGIYERERGNTGVCVYARVVPVAGGDTTTTDGWRIAAWAGFAWCGDAATRDMADNPAAPNRMP